jgi:hypothetical protein
MGILRRLQLETDEVVFSVVIRQQQDGDMLTAAYSGVSLFAASNSPNRMLIGFGELTSFDEALLINDTKSEIERRFGPIRDVVQIPNQSPDFPSMTGPARRSRSQQ